MLFGYSYIGIFKNIFYNYSDTDQTYLCWWMRAEAMSIPLQFFISLICFGVILIALKWFDPCWGYQKHLAFKILWCGIDTINININVICVIILIFGVNYWDIC